MICRAAASEATPCAIHGSPAEPNVAHVWSQNMVRKGRHGAHAWDLLCSEIRILALPKEVRCGTKLTAIDRCLIISDRSEDESWNSHEEGSAFTCKHTLR